MSTHSTTRRCINPSTLLPPPGYTQVVAAGRTVFISGQAALDRSGKLVGKGDFQAQAIQVFENLEAALLSVGADFSSLVKITIYVVDIDQIQTLIEIRDRYINTGAPPASTLVAVKTLVQAELLIEIDAIAVLMSAKEDQ